eukprot:CAMPEP_0183723114 /NCGR_PEP_ID=MMETSP0737-20130205/14821_1 /TAXON_ID=385413 /ORGANISM="Thalassiosira miniscula, Strain CCMP1093" /LENGTH=361 /DNA_ID=CAMNT_0025953365 /DNA_START=277 /DNA_END=1362 /DNA_ORIENTATION=+
MASLGNMVLALIGVFMSLCSWQLAAVNAFAPPSSNIDTKSIRSQSYAPLGASVYYPDDWDSGSNGYEETSSNDIFGGFGSGISTPFDEAFLQIATQLSSDPAVTSTLAKLASAFSPPGFDIDLGNINDVRCHAVDGRHLEIEAVVCDDLQCSSLLVPVDFPEECSVEGHVSECILRNVHHLDATGERILQEKQQVFEEESDARRAFEALQSLDSEYLAPHASEGGSLPYWWVPALASEDEQECELLQQLLNGDDLQEMMRGLASHVLYLHGPPMNADGSLSQDFGEGSVVRSVHVKAVGPAGLVLRVQYSVGGKTWEDVGGLNNEAVMDLPVKFEDMDANYVSGRRSIREEVLMMVSSVNA